MNQREQELLDKQLWGCSSKSSTGRGHRVGGRRRVFGRYGCRWQFCLLTTASLDTNRVE